jgi:hypothetical protein
MAKIEIRRKSGAASPYFWSDKQAGDPKKRTVYKQTEEGVKRMRGVHYDSVARKLHVH